LLYLASYFPWGGKNLPNMRWTANKKENIGKLFLKKVCKLLMDLPDDM